MIDKLKSEVLLVSFIKKNGEPRQMLCTLMDEYIPKVVGETKRNKDGLITVYDLENEGWRSFYEDSITDIKVV